MTRPALTPRQAAVLRRIARACERRPEGSVETNFIGSRGTCQELLDLGCITKELKSLGPLGGRYYSYRLSAESAPDAEPSSEGDDEMASGASADEAEDLSSDAIAEV